MRVRTTFFVRKCRTIFRHFLWFVKEQKEHGRIRHFRWRHIVFWWLEERRGSGMTEKTNVVPLNSSKTKSLGDFWINRLFRSVAPLVKPLKEREREGRRIYSVVGFFDWSMKGRRWGEREETYKNIIIGF